MENNKKTGIVIGVLLLLAGVGAAVFFLIRKKKKGEATNVGAATVSGPSASSGITPKPHNAARSASTKLIGAGDILSAGIKGLDLQQVFATKPANVYNMASQISFKVNAGDLLGTASYSRPSDGGGFIVYFSRGKGTKYWLNSDAVGIKA